MKIIKAELIKLINAKLAANEAALQAKIDEGYKLAGPQKTDEQKAKEEQARISKISAYVLKSLKVGTIKVSAGDDYFTFDNTALPKELCVSKNTNHEKLYYIKQDMLHLEHVINRIKRDLHLAEITAGDSIAIRTDELFGYYL